MAKKKKEQELDEYGQPKEKKGSKILTTLIFLLIFIIFLGILALLIKLDIGGFGSNVLRPVLKDVPGINKILPSVSDEQLAKENDYPYDNIADAMARIKELEATVKSLKSKNTDKSTTVADLQSEVDRLKVFEENQKEFQKQKKEFDKNVVFNANAPDVTEYQKYYEQIDPANAEEIYRQVLQQIQATEDIKNQAERFSKMKPEEAAPILETMTGDIDLVANILRNMSTSDSGAILAKMDTTIAAKITKMLSMMN